MKIRLAERFNDGKKENDTGRYLFLSSYIFTSLKNVRNQLDDLMRRMANVSMLFAL